MKTFILILISLISLNAFSWGEPPLASKELRQKEYAFAIKSDKKTAYTKYLIWLAKKLVDSNKAIKFKDADLGIVIINPTTPCDVLKFGSGFGKDQRIDFSLEVTFKDNIFEAKIEDLIGRSPGTYDDAARPSTKEEAELAFKSCVEPYLAEIKSAL